VEVAGRERRGKAIGRRVASHWMQRRSAAAFDTWHEHSKEQRRVAGVCSKAVLRMQQQGKSEAFFGWLGNVQEEKRLKRAADKVCDAGVACLLLA